MSSLRASVSRLLTFSCVDGPGNRLVLFLQGCNFRCPACHNPHTIGECDHCGDCLAVCPDGALSRQGERVVWDEALCTRCDACLDICPRSASPKVSEMSVEQVVAVVRRYAPLLTGITVSGGEATLRLPFLVALFGAIKGAADLAHLTCLVDSNGFLAEAGWRRLLPVCDGVMVDLKGWKESVHLSLTGRSRERVHDSLRLLARAGKLAEVRLLHIPGRSDLHEHCAELAGLLAELGPVPVRINGFRHHGVRGEARQWPRAGQEQLEQLAQGLRDRGCRSPIALPAL